MKYSINLNIIQVAILIFLAPLMTYGQSNEIGVGISFKF